jgi:hypothetical protein
MVFSGIYGKAFESFNPGFRASHYYPYVGTKIEFKVAENEQLTGRYWKLYVNRKLVLKNQKKQSIEYR